MRSTSVRFADTNILLYAIARDQSERGKASRANEILATGEIALSTQVLQEFYVQATRATRDDAITHEQAVGLVESFLRFPGPKPGRFQRRARELSCRVPRVMNLVRHFTHFSECTLCLPKILVLLKEKQSFFKRKHGGLAEAFLG